MRGLRSLRWTSPSPAFPHGFAGVISVAVGAGLIAYALCGDLSAASSTLSLGLYAVSSCVNAAAGLAIGGSAPRNVRNIFRSCAVFQLSLLYFVARFSPSFPAGRSAAVALLDRAVSLLTVIGVASFALAAAVKLPLAVGAGVMVGSLALALLTGYPLQLAILGQEWWECVHTAYPKQGLAMVAYIYVPATWAFAVMLFGATLWSRKLIGDLALGGGFAGLVLATLVSTVLMQEVHLPDVSTQMLWLPCPTPPPDSWSAWIATKFDTSALARSALALMR